MMLRAPAFRRSPLVFGGCFHDPIHLEGEFHRRFVEPLIGIDARIEGALFVWGADDPTFPVPRAREMLRQFPNAVGFHEVKNAKRFIYEEHPQEVARHIDGFLT